MRFFAAVVFLLLRDEAASQIRFEVASMKPAPVGGMVSISPPGAAKFSGINVSLSLLIGFAYGVDSDRISGLPGWSESQLYDVIGKPEGPGGLSYEQLRPMLQELLADRVNLAVHHEKRLAPGYALVVAKGGPRLKKNAGESDKRYILPGGLLCTNVTLDVLAGMIARPAGRPVVDRTGIQGNYDIELHYARDEERDATLPSLFTALEDQLGLKLETQKVEVDVVVVDHVERMPTAN
jgi:uncharacterized protein (TIGR03435 family)